MTKTVASATATAGACPRCFSPWRCVRHGEFLHVLCNADKCAMRRILLHGCDGGLWAAVVAEESTFTVLCVGPESRCWDSLLRDRRSGQLAIVAPLAGV